MTWTFGDWRDRDGEMSQLLVRVRPQRVAVLIGEKASVNSFMLCAEFLSSVWGGRYCPILVVVQKTDGSEAKRGLSSIRPEIVAGIDVDHNKWSAISSQMCQPRRYLQLDRALINDLMTINRTHLIGAVSIAAGVKEAHPTEERERLLLLRIPKNGELSPFAAACFGFAPQNQPMQWAEFLNAKAGAFPARGTVPNYVRLCIEMSGNWSWIDFASSYLHRSQLGGPLVLPPTIVLVKDTVIDLVLYWNLRMALGAGSSGRLIPFPANAVKDEESVKALFDWLSHGPVDANYCILTSKKGSRLLLQKLAARLRPRLRNARFKHVDIEESSDRIPLVIPYEQETPCRAFVVKGNIQLDTVRPAGVSKARSTDEWVCDLPKDIRTNRAPFEMYPLPRLAAFEVLNAPIPPTIGAGVPLLGYGMDAVNIKCSSRTSGISIGIPQDDEILEEVLYEKGVQIRKDEKRTRYAQAVDVLGGPAEAARALTGTSRLIVESLQDEPLTVDKIKSIVKSGASVRRKTHWALDWMRRTLPKHALRVAERRLDEYRKGFDDDNVVHVLNKLADRGAVMRKWFLDRCSFCDRSYWVENIHLASPIHCPGCQKRISLKSKVILGYALNELLKLSLREGIVPVILAARFLYNLTSKGFLCLPGVRCSKGGIDTDIDLFAACDGQLLSVECKSLRKARVRKETWSAIRKDLRNPIEIAKGVGVKAFVFAALASKIPSDFKNAISRLAGKKMATLFLCKEDLETGFRRVPLGAEKRPLSIDDILPTPPKSRKRKRRRKGERFVRF